MSLDRIFRLPCINLGIILSPIILLSAFGAFSQNRESLPESTSTQVSFRVQVDTRISMITLETEDVDGVLYCSLVQLVDQLGGGHSISWGKVQVDYRGSSALISINTRKVNASYAGFSLKYPLIHRLQVVLIAIDDVQPFLDNAFRTKTTMAQRPVSSVLVEEVHSEDPPIETTSVIGEGVSVQELIELSSDSELEIPIAAEVVVPTIILDAGHGGYDKGSEGRHGLLEKDISLKVALKLTELFRERQDFSVFITREDDTDMSIEDRAMYAAENKGSIFLSIHAGESRAIAAHGFEVFYAGMRKGISDKTNTEARSRSLALIIAKTFQAATSAELRGIRKLPCAILQRVNMPGVLIEVGCLNSETEEALLANEEYITNMANGIVEGIVEHVALMAETMDISEDVTAGISGNKSRDDSAWGDIWPQ